MVRAQAAMDLIQSSRLGISFRGPFEKLETAARLQLYRIRSYRPNVELFFEHGRYLIKTAASGEDLEQCLRLRYQVFHREYKNATSAHGVDVDGFDSACDHLMIIDKKTQMPVATYRLNSSLFSKKFYSSSEFQMADILALPGPKLELGRACIQKEFRNGVVLSLLWRGISEYLRRTETGVLFGCASIKITQSIDIARVTKYLRDSGHMLETCEIRPTLKYTIQDLPKATQVISKDFDSATAESLIPSLLWFYLRAGAKICGEPALDRDFNCADFLILLDSSTMNPAIREKYKVPGPVFGCSAEGPLP